MHKKIIAVTAIMLLGFVSIVTAEVKANFKVGYIDIQKALNVCKAGKEAAAKLQKALEKAQKKYETQGENLKKEKENMERQAPLLDEDVLQDRMRDFRGKYRDWERFRKDTEADIRQKHNEMVEKITKELIEFSSKIGEEGGYTLILERSMVPYVDESLDVTDRVIKLHNEEYQKKEVTSPAQ
ncbi:MAG: OmpH family outer membrane protein [Proteobacteria bacterium]|nr:OmpH family outer membrane protein [Pseudomonadota bacterium]